MVNVSWIIAVMMSTSSAINRLEDRKLAVFKAHPHHKNAGMGLLHHDMNHHHPRFVNMMELMDPLESRKIDSISTEADLIEMVDYLRSYAVEECREIVCSPKGKKRFTECAESLISTDKQCRPGCQDHLQMWVIKRCYLIETFDCDGNIGPGSVSNTTMVFNKEGPQTLAEFTTSMEDLFGSKGINCDCCDFSNVLVVKSSLTYSVAFALVGLVISTTIV
jgi:hypothetical protein